MDTPKALGQSPGSLGRSQSTARSNQNTIDSLITPYDTQSSPLTTAKRQQETQEQYTPRSPSRPADAHDSGHGLVPPGALFDSSSAVGNRDFSNNNEDSAGAADGGGPSEEPSAKRRRKALACYDCRRRKLKCDRLWPACSRCMKAGQPNACRYDNVPEPGKFGNGVEGGSAGRGAIGHWAGHGGLGARGESTSAEEADEVGCVYAEAVHILAPRQLGATSGLVRRAKGETGLGGSEALSKSVLQARRIERLEERVAQLETRSLGPQVPRPWARGADAEPEGRDGKNPGLDMMFLKGKGLRTIYYGSSQPTSMISQFPELRGFMKDTILQYPALARVQGELRSINSRAKAINDASARDSPLLPLLPSKPATDRMVRLYLDTLEKLYRIVHVPTFQQEYTSFWENPKGTKSDFVAIVLLMVSCVISMSSESHIRFVGKSSVARERAITWTSAVESWLDKQSYKHSSTTRYQIMILLDIAKHMNSIKKKRHWETAGRVLRFGMAIGLHRDPGLLIGKMTFFEDQMRRRLWATMVEWELQASVTRGFPAASANVTTDCPPPLNLDDDQFSAGTVQPPVEKNVKEHTETSFLFTAQKSLKLRRQLNSMVNDITTGFSYEDVLAYEEKIMHEIESIPSTWDDPTSIPGGGSDTYLMETVLLDVQLRQYLIWLHFPFASRTDTRYSYSKTACFNAASTMLDQHSKLMAQGEYTLCLLRNDGYLAAICICHNVFASSLLRSDIVFKSLNISFSQFVENALSMLEEKVMRLGECRNHHWFISAAYSFVQAKVAPETAQLTKQQAVDRSTKLFYRILATQEDNLRQGVLTPSATTGTTGTGGATTPNTTGFGEFNQASAMQSGGNGFSAINTPQIADPTNVQPLDPFEFFDLSEWALDNLWPIDNMDVF